jgi:signal transduction histidine kinase
MLWRLPLFIFLLFGVVTLAYVDGVLRSEYRKEAGAQALQTDALLESFLTLRVSELASVRALVRSAKTSEERHERFETLAREMIGLAPDIYSIYLLNRDGTVTDQYRRSTLQVIIPKDNHLRIPDRAQAILQAARTKNVAFTGTVKLANGAMGIMTYLPIVEDSVVVGFIGGAMAYQPLFEDALAGQLQGQFAYRIVDEAGRTVAMSAEFPERTSRVVRRDISVPRQTLWHLDVAIPAFQPRIPRLVNLVVGPLLLLLVLFMVLREEARARRFGEHTLDLELMSANLLSANLRLEERSHQIAEANAAKSRFLANVSHELRTPINAIVGYNSLALESVYGPMPEPLTKAHLRIRAASDHLLKLVDDVLDLSKIEVGRLALDLEPVDLQSLLDGIGTVVGPIAESKQLRINYSVSSDLPRITSDASRLRQILLNLMSNSIKFSDHGTIEVTARRSPRDPEHSVWIAVTDTGIGIAQSDQDRIFEEFEQVRPSGRGDSIQRGTGLGLAISRKLARLLGGELQVESELGQGATFTLMLPINAPVSAEPVVAGTPETTPIVPHDALAPVADEQMHRAGDAGSEREADSVGAAHDADSLRG